MDTLSMISLFWWKIHLWHRFKIRTCDNTAIICASGTQRDCHSHFDPAIIPFCYLSHGRERSTFWEVRAHLSSPISSLRVHDERFSGEHLTHSRRCCWRHTHQNTTHLKSSLIFVTDLVLICFGLFLLRVFCNINSNLVLPSCFYIRKKSFFSSLLGHGTNVRRRFFLFLVPPFSFSPESSLQLHRFRWEGHEPASPWDVRVCSHLEKRR